jgi:hypothetical protein
MLGDPIQKGWSVELQLKAPSLYWNLCSKSFTNCFKANASLTNAVKIIEDHDWTLPTPLAGHDSKKVQHIQNNAPNVDSGGDDDDSSSNDKCPGGFFLQSMNEDIEWTLKIHEHAKTCSGNFAPVIGTKKKG